MSLRWLAPVAAAAAYLFGLFLHEATHVVACWLTGSTVEYVQLYPPEVGYVAPDHRADRLVRVATLVVTVPLLVGYMLWLSEDVWSWRLIGLAAVAGYLPRSESDWQPVADLLKSAVLQR